MRVPCPRCGAIHDIQPPDFGRQMKCYECASMLSVDREGTVRVAQAGAHAEPAARRRSEPMTDYNSGSGTGGGAAGVLFTIILALGTMAIIVCLFLPAIDFAKVQSHYAPIRAREAKERRLDDENRREIDQIRDFDKKGNEARDAKRKEREEARKQWETERKSLDEKAEAAELRARQSLLYYRWGLMIGYLVLSVGAVGFLCSSQTPRRIVGAIVLTGPLSMIFFSYLIQTFTYYSDYR
jgi:hypothetical protein